MQVMDYEKRKAKDRLRVQRLMEEHHWPEAIAKRVVARTMSYEDAENRMEYQRQLKAYTARKRFEGRMGQGGTEQDRRDFPMCFFDPVRDLRTSILPEPSLRGSQDRLSAALVPPGGLRSP